METFNIVVWDTLLKRQEGAARCLPADTGDPLYRVPHPQAPFRAPDPNAPWKKEDEWWANMKVFLDEEIGKAETRGYNRGVIDTKSLLINTIHAIPED